MDDEKQCMSDSLDFTVGQTTQVTQRGMLKISCTFDFQDQKEMHALQWVPSNGQIMTIRATLTRK